MTRWLFRWASWSIDRPKLAVLLVLLLTAAAAPGLLRLEMRTDGHALVPPNDPAVLFDAEVREQFQLRDPVAVVIETAHPEGIYNPGTLRRVQALTAALARLDGIGPQNVVSLATERRDRVYPGTLTFRTLLDPFPGDARLLGELRKDIAAIGILDGTLVSKDGRATAILVGAPLSREDGRRTFDRTALYRDIRATTAPFQSTTDRILVVGAPVAESLLGAHVQEDLLLLLPLSILLITVIIGYGCRRPWGVALGMAEVVGCLVWTFGLMGWMGVPAYLTTSLLPVILAAVGVADDIHLIWRYQRVLARTEDQPHPSAVRQTMSDMARPIALTSLTTLIGFLSFNSSPMAPVRSFGLFAGIGIFYCILYSLTVMPAAFTLLGPDKLRHPRLRLAAGPAVPRSDWQRSAHEGAERDSWTSPPPADVTPGARVDSWVARLAWPLVRRRGATLAALVLITLAVGAGVSRLRVQDGWVDGFAPASPFRQETDRVNQLFDGTHTLLAHLTFDGPREGMPSVEGGRQGPLLDAAKLEAVGDFEEFLRRQSGVGGVLGAHSQLAAVHFLWQARREGERRIPTEGPEFVDTLLNFYDMVRGETRRREVIHDDMRRTVVTVFLKNANYQETAALMRAARDYERRHLAPLGARLDFAGDVAVSQAMIPAIVRTQIVSLLLALVGSFAAVCLLYRSLRVGVYTLLPPAIAALWMFGVMGWTGIPLGVATSMFFAITLGIGVDYAIHFMERVQAAPVDPDGTPPVLWALREAGPAITADAFAIALGFGLLVLSQVPSNARLGALVCVALLASWVLTLIGLGALLAKPSAAGAPAAQGWAGESVSGVTGQ